MTVDDELLGLFHDEAATRLRRMAEHLLALEGREAGGSVEVDELVAGLFREAHTLKGAAAVVGLEDVAATAHRLEDRLEALRADATPLAAPARAQVVDELLAGVDALRDAVAAASSAMGSATGSVGPVVALPAAVAPARRAGPPPGHEVLRVPVHRIDALVRAVGEAASAHLRLRGVVARSMGAAAAESLPEMVALGRALATLQEQAVQTRTVPLATTLEPLRRAVRDAARQRGVAVRLEVRGEDTELDRSVLEQLGPALLHLVRNAVMHGVEATDERRAAGKPDEAVVRVHTMQLGPEVTITVADDGRGVDVVAVRRHAAALGLDVAGLSDVDVLPLLFRRGLSTAAEVGRLAGRGVGLDVVAEGVGAVRGRVEVRSDAGLGTEFRLIVPVSLTVLTCLLVDAGGQRLALPLHAVGGVARPAAGELQALDGGVVARTPTGAVPAVDLEAVLGLARAPGSPARRPCAVVVGLGGRAALLVDRLVGMREVVVAELPRCLPRLPCVAGASAEPDGSTLVVLDPSGLLAAVPAVRTSRSLGPPSGEGADVDRAAAHAPKVLVVDDALTVRELQRAILERAGYRVDVAADGEEALARLASGPVDVVLTDVEMPRLDGIGLVRRLRADGRFDRTGIIVLTSRSSEADRRLALEAGADGYIVKASFDEQALLQVVAGVLGGRP